MYIPGPQPTNMPFHLLPTKRNINPKTRNITLSPQQKPPPPASDIAAYNDIFRPTTNTAKALKALSANAKKDTIRAAVAQHLQSLYQPPSEITVPKNKSHVNPYFDILAWSNQSLEWAGPESTTHKIKISHALLPVLYHHFSCVCPSFEALEIVRLVAKGRGIVDVGSGNGYWTYMLRRVKDGKKKNLEVVPVDNGLSDWRTLWVADTVEMDGAEWLKRHEGGRGHVLLLVYPQVSHDFTAKTIKAYREFGVFCCLVYAWCTNFLLLLLLLDGSTIVVAGTQNANGYTAFANELLVDWFARVMPKWEKVCQIPLPSFAGKDEALFVYEKKP